MKFNEIADAGSKALSATFFSRAIDPVALKAGVTAGLKQSLGTSFGVDAGLDLSAKPGMHA